MNTPKSYKNKKLTYFGFEPRQIIGCDHIGYLIPLSNDEFSTMQCVNCNIIIHNKDDIITHTQISYNHLI
jgi:hypothetical protein